MDLALPVAPIVNAHYERRMIGDRHRLIRHLASGGMGHVFLAEHLTLGSRAAVKVLPRSASAEAVHAFRTEARLLARLQHPNIVRVTDHGRLADGDHYLVMEFLAGIDLNDWLDRHGAMPATRALWVLKQLASAVDYLHAQGIVHRDIKPENVMLREDVNDAIKLLDFGVAFQPRILLCDPASMIGTPGYMAPEQILGEPCGPAIDLYALAAFAFELLVGVPLFDCVSTEETLLTLEQPLRLPSQHGLVVKGLDAVMTKALARDPAKRYASGDAFVCELSRVFAQVPRARVARGQLTAPHTRKPSSARRVAAYACAAATWLVPACLSACA